MFFNDINKEVVFFVGPAAAASTSVERWFYNYYENPDSDQYSLRHWRWPIIDGPESNALDNPYKIFRELVLQPSNNELKQEIYDAIKVAFKESHTGIILGTEEFDQIGPYAVYNALDAMKEIMSLVNAKKKDVTVIIDYRTPRFHQWISLWKHSESELSYKDYMCSSKDDEQSRKERIRQLATHMDPMSAALTYLKEGFKVKIIDMEGVKAVGKDVVNVIVCDILEGKCLLDDKIVYGHRGDETHFNVIEEDFEELSQEQIDKAEELFLYRDCALHEELSDYEDLEIFYMDSLFKDCFNENAEKESIYEYLDRTPEAVYSSLLTQLGCPEADGLSIEQALKGKELVRQPQPMDITTQSNGIMNQSGGLDGGDGPLHHGFFFVLLSLLVVGAVKFLFVFKIGRPKSKSKYFDQTHRTSSIRETEMSEMFSDEDAWKIEDYDYGIFSFVRGGAEKKAGLSLTV